MVQGKFLSGRNDLSEVYLIRRKVFIEENKVPEEIEFDNMDENAMHVIIYEEYKNKYAVATGRIRLENDIAKIDKVAVLKEFRGKYYGDFVIKMLLDKAKTSGIMDIEIVSNNAAKGFFERLGFQQKDCVFSEKGEEYIKLTYIKKECPNCCQK